MEQFLYGLLAGVALGMWLAIMLYTFAGKRQERLTLRRRQARDAQISASKRDPAPSARALDGRPEDDFDDYYEQQDADGKAAPEHGTVPAIEQAIADVDEDAGDVAGDDAGGDAEDADKTEDEDERDEDDDLGVADDEVYRRLVDKMDGDTAAAERLIDYERDRTPAAPRAAWVQNALDRLEYGRV